MCDICLESGLRLQAPATPSNPGDIDPSASRLLARLAKQNELVLSATSPYNIFADSLVNITPTMSGNIPILLACTQLAVSSSAVDKVASSSNARNEVHGVHTLPACFDIATAFLKLGDKLEKLIELKFILPIVNELDLVVFYDSKPKLTAFKGRDLALEASFKTSSGIIFIKGYFSNKTVTRAVTLPTEIFHVDIPSAKNFKSIRTEQGNEFTLTTDFSAFNNLNDRMNLPSVRQYLLLEQVAYYYGILVSNQHIRLPFDTKSPHYKMYISRYKDCDIPSIEFFKSGIMSLSLAVSHEVNNLGNNIKVQRGFYTMQNELTGEICRGTIDTASVLQSKTA